MYVYITSHTLYGAGHKVYVMDYVTLYSECMGYARDLLGESTAFNLEDDTAFPEINGE